MQYRHCPGIGNVILAQLLYLDHRFSHYAVTMSLSNFSHKPLILLIRSLLIDKKYCL